MTPLLLLFALLPSQEAWTSLPVPGLCREPLVHPCPPPTLAGEHLVLAPAASHGRGSDSARPLPAALPLSLLLDLVQEDARRAGSSVQVMPLSSSLLARGPAAGVNALAARLAELDAAGARLTVELEAWLVPGNSGEWDGAGAPPGEELARERGLAWRGSVPSGAGLCFGARETRPFLAGYRVDVASDSGVASPLVGQALLGKTLHVVASRARRGTAVHIEGFLDLAELAALDTFDPGTPDLGVVEQPVVRSVQVAFSGAVESGGVLRVDLRGAPLEETAWTLWLRARTRADAAPAGGAGWQLLDLALLARAPRYLPGLEPSSAIDASSSREAGLPRTGDALSPSALAAGLPSDPRRATFPTFTDRIALVQVDERGASAELDALRMLYDAVESERLVTRTVQLEHGTLRASFPVSQGSHARLRAGVERVWLVDYDAQIAPDTWMPVPVVERTFDGLAWQGTLAGQRIECAYWAADTRSSRVLRAEEARLGAVQLPVREVRGGAGEFTATGVTHLLLQAAPEGDLTLGLRLL